MMDIIQIDTLEDSDIEIDSIVDSDKEVDSDLEIIDVSDLEDDINNVDWMR